MRVPMKPFFQKFPWFQTADPDECQYLFEPLIDLNVKNVSADGSGYKAAINRVELPSITLAYGAYGSQMQPDIRLKGFIQEFPLTASVEGHWNRRDLITRPGQSGAVGGPGCGGAMTYGADYSHVFQVISSDALTRKLSAMIGDPLDHPLEMTGRPNSDPSFSAMQLRLITFFCDEFDRNDGLMPGIVTAEIEQAVIAAFLTTNEHNYSKCLEGTPRAAAPWQVRRAVDYIESNWNKPITIEDLVDAANTSARSLFYLFRRTYGISPMLYANRVRLRRANLMLSKPDAKTSVSSVAFDCGFSNLGHFAKRYHTAFGELPSETLKKFL